MTRVAAAGLIAGSLTGAVALRPTPAHTASHVPTQSRLQAIAAVSVLDERAASEARARTSALRVSRAVLASRHQAYLRSRAAQAAAQRARAVAAAAAASAVSAAAATRARTVVEKPAPESPVARGLRLYASLHYDVTRLGYRIVVKPSAHGLLGLTDATTRTITVYVRSGESDLVVAHSIAHEIGHAVDFTRGSAAKHQLYLTIRHLPRQQWYGCNDCTDYATPAGDWAEVFAQWLVGPGDFRSRMAGVPTAAELTLLTPLFSL